ncbi:hypothetical protein ACWGCI_36615, partial [Streptomyces sp. NPDC054949]
DATVADARAYVHTALSTNSLATLNHAKTHAETHAENRSANRSENPSESHTETRAETLSGNKR